MNNKIKIGLGILIIISIILIVLKLKGEFATSTSTSTSTPLSYTYDDTSLKIVTGAFEGLDSYVIGVDPSNNNTSNLFFNDVYLIPITNGIVAAERRLWGTIVTDVSNIIASSSNSTLLNTAMFELLSQANAEIDAHYAVANAKVMDKYVTMYTPVKIESVLIPPNIKKVSFQEGWMGANYLIIDKEVKLTDKFIFHPRE
jgi:hypothetical protein